MAKRRKPIEQYDHKEKKRVNNPPVGLVTPETDKEGGMNNELRKAVTDLEFNEGNTITNFIW